MLWREGDKYFLKTPVEKVGIVVDDAPFTAVEMKAEGEGAARTLSFRTNADDWVTCGPGHALRFEPEEETGGLKPYLHVRRDLWALVTRALFYDLVELGEERDVAGRRMFGVASGGEFFAMAPADIAEGACADGRRCAMTARVRSSDRAISSSARGRASPSTCRRRCTTTRSRSFRAAISTAIRARGKRPAPRRRGRPPCWCRWSITPSRACCSPCAPRTCRTMPGRSPFPGGKIDPGDATPLAAALREADEEIGLDAALIEPIGYLDLYLTFTGFRILPVLARVSRATS